MLHKEKALLPDVYLYVLGGDTGLKQKLGDVHDPT